MIARVYVNTGNLNIDKPFDYAVPQRLEGKVCAGVRVRVPFGAGNRPREAIITELSDKSDFDNLKQLSSVTDAFPVLTKSAIELCFYMRENCFCTFYEAARLMLPPGSNARFEEWISIKNPDSAALTPAQKKVVRLIEELGGTAESEQIKAALGRGALLTVRTLVKNGIAEKSYRDKRAAAEKTRSVVSYCGSYDIYTAAQSIRRAAPAQAAVLDFLAENTQAPVSELCRNLKVSRKSVDDLALKGLVKIRTVAVPRNPQDGKERTADTPPALTNEQQSAVQAVQGEGVYLLHGVTGSGKTEVFMRLVQSCISRGKQAIVLVPEISLTPQMTQRFYARFGSDIAVVHSALSMGERFDEWGRIKRGEAKLIIGARSGIFSPCDKLGLIIIDEEHEQTYKSERTPRYHTRDIARFIAKRAHIPLVLASATPSVESYTRAKSGEYTLIEMKKRFNDNALPSVMLADMRKELREGNKTVLSRALAAEIRENLQNKEQTILFLNRRGYSTFVSCRDCGFVFMCPSCSVALTYHKGDALLNCHWCGHSEKAPSECPVCKSKRIKDFGRGTQKAQEQIQAIFPTAKIVRMDADTTSGKCGHEKLLEKFSDEGGDILLGTQMVTKGLDFENVTLVGVLAADAALNVDDFRAQERTFDLITQVCGRAGRGQKPGRAVIQTYSPENKTLLMAARQDYAAFYDEEIMFRKEFCYPPFCDIVSITISSSDESEASLCAENTARELRVALRSFNVKLYGPTKAPMYKVDKRYRRKILIKAESICDSLLVELRVIIHSKYGKIKSDLSVSADINPISVT